MAKSKRKQTKARAEYQKARANYLQNIRRYVKAGLLRNAPVPELAQQTTKAKDLNKLTRELKRLNKMAKQYASDIRTELTKRKKKEFDTEIINKYLEGVRTGRGGRVIGGAIDTFRTRYGDSVVAKMLRKMEQNGAIMTNALYYDVGVAEEHVSKMEKVLNRYGVMSKEDMIMTERLMDENMITDEETEDLL